MPILMVVNNPKDWPLVVPGVEVVAARQYLTDARFAEMRHTRVFNLCRSYRYQATGYYVSLLAEARGHKPLPDVVTIQDMKSAALARVIADDLDQLIQKTLRPIKTDEFTLSIYFGKTLAQRDRQLGARLFGMFTSPMLRAHFVRRRSRWLLQSIRPIAASEITESHHSEVVTAAREYFVRREWSGRTTRPPRAHLAVLVDPNEEQPPSDPGAIDRLRKAAHSLQVGTELITRDDFGRLGEFDALFIRTTTAVNHFTYRFARRASAERMPVIDDPVSIARCTNKVYLAERLTKHHVPIPQTMIVHRGNAEQVAEQLSLPCVLKQPDSAFSAGVAKVHTAEELKQKLDELLNASDLIIAQRYTPTDFDWRVGVLDGQPLYVCRYFMARQHWQIQHRDAAGRIVEGRAETIDVNDAPRKVVQAAVKASRLIGDGLYGVDLKQIGDRVVVIEVNDNPSIEAGCEDRVLKEKLYERIIQSFLDRIERARNGLHFAARHPHHEAEPV